MLLTACGTPSGDERGTTTHEESVTWAGTKTADVTEPNTVRLNGDYDSVPTMTVPERLSSEELDSIVIPVSADDPYSAIIANELIGISRLDHNTTRKWRDMPCTI